jgi:malonate-semialdehyde dehydrogenase (acetylating) / methylmalonate-semialdehyde dehydrogenase
MKQGAVKNFIGGEWVTSHSRDFLPIVNPATREVVGRVPAGASSDAAAAVEAAAAAFPEWRCTPREDRVQYLFRLKQLLEEHVEEIARICTAENGKTLSESRAEVRRAIENAEVACGIPMLLQGYNLEDVARGINETMIRQPLVVVAAITPFNFPAMISFWFLPYAVACGNTFILKPSEKVPLTARRCFGLLEELKLPPGVVNLVHGSKTVVDALLDHPQVWAISFVGSTPVAKYIYGRALASSKRVQCQGGAKNHVIVLPDADMETSTRILAESAFGCAGQRCPAVSVAATVGDAQTEFSKSRMEVAAIRVGNGLEDAVQMGPVITPESNTRVEVLIDQGTREGAQQLLDGRVGDSSSLREGNFVKPTVLDDVPPRSRAFPHRNFRPRAEFGKPQDVRRGDADNRQKPLRQCGISIHLSRRGHPGISLRSAGRKHRHQPGVAAPMAYFPFSGWRDSFFGVLHGQGRDGVEFYTEEKVVIERWHRLWSRKF